MSSFKENEFKNLKFRSVSYNKIECAVQLLKKLGYEEIHSDFSVYDAASHNGICAWDDGEITEGWLDDDNFEQVTLEELKEMVSDEEVVFWLNKNTLEEKYLKAGNAIRGIGWVEVPDGATFATGDKDSFVFRKGGWYYEDGVWVATELTFDKVGNYSQLKLFWVKGDVKDNVFTIERLLGCEVMYKGDNYLVTSIYSVSRGKHVILYNGTALAYVSDLKLLTFFTEGGDELTFDGYVAMYYGE